MLVQLSHPHRQVEIKGPKRTKELLRELKANRNRDVAAVRSTRANSHAGSNGGLFSRLRETFSGR